MVVLSINICALLLGATPLDSVFSVVVVTKGPGAPGAPCTPGVPVVPVAPVYPGSPVTPVGPVTPCGPARATADISVHVAVKSDTFLIWTNDPDRAIT